MAVAAIVGRVLFRIIFNVEDGHPTAIHLPTLFVSLGFGPEVRLFGPVSWHALLVSSFDGVRLAALLVGFSILFTLFDVRSLLARAPKPLQPIALPVGSALTFVPILAGNIQRIQSAVKLRGRKSTSIITPVFEATVERALALSQSMEVRGFGSPALVDETPVVLQDFGLYLDGRMVLERISFEAKPGTISLILGATGSGKTLLLKSMCNLAPQYSGGKVFGLKTGGSAAYVNQQPELSFVAERVEAEIAFALVQRGFRRQDLKLETDRLANLLGIAHLIGRNTSELSAGEQQRVAIAAALASGCKTLLLDEPSSALDSAGVSELLSALTAVRNSGVAVVIVEHHVDRFSDISDEFFLLESAHLRALNADETRALLMRNLPQIELGSGINVFVGPNGSGKSTMLRKVASENAGAALVPQVASDLLLATKVEDELEDEHGHALFSELVGDFDPSKHPHDLSAGMQLALAIAVQLGRDSRFILLDEPTRGFDFETKSRLIQMIRRLRLSGYEFFIATNDEEFGSALGGKVTKLEAVSGSK